MKTQPAIPTAYREASGRDDILIDWYPKRDSIYCYQYFYKNAFDSGSGYGFE